MATAEGVKEIQKVFGTNHIYAKTVFALTKTSEYLDEASKIISEKPKPFVKWVGGKRQLLSQFHRLGLYPPENFDPNRNRYFEPFVGGGAVFFDLLPKKAVLSDLNSELICTYLVIKEDVESLIKILKKMPYEKEYFLKVRAQRVSSLSPLDVASRFIYLNRTCFNGMYRVNSRGDFNVPFGRYTNPQICDENSLRRVSKALIDVQIANEDYKKSVKRAKKGDFIYFDPPYHPLNSTSSFTAYTKEGFGKKEQLELRDTFLDLHKRGCFVMLSNSSADFILQIYNEISDFGVKINYVDAGRAINSKAGSRGKIKEVLITNY